MAGFLDYLKDASAWLKSEENQGTVGLLSMLGTAAFSGSDFFDTQIDKRIPRENPRLHSR